MVNPTRLLTCIIIGMALTGCGSLNLDVKPYQRAYLSDPLMQYPATSRHEVMRKRVNESIEASRGAAEHPGEPGQLPADQANVSFHNFANGSEKDIRRTEILLRKSMQDRYAIEARHTLDKLDDESIDVLTTASAYQEDHQQTELKVYYLHNRARLDAAARVTDQEDLESTSLILDLQQPMQDQLNMLLLGFSRSWEIVKPVGNEREFDRDQHRLRIGWEQVLNPQWKGRLKYELIGDSGYLENPYRAARILDTFVPESLPDNRVSHTLLFESMYYLEGRSVAIVSYRWFTDSWDVDGHTFQIRHRNPVEELWMIDTHYRMYRQTASSLYSDNLNTGDIANPTVAYLTRRPSLSDIKRHSFGIALSRTSNKDIRRFFQQSHLSFGYELTRTTYGNYTDLTDGSDYQNNQHLLHISLSGRF